MGQFCLEDAEGQTPCRMDEADARLQKQVKTRVAPRTGAGEFMRRSGQLFLILAIGVFAAGCPKGKQDYSMAKKAADAQDYDAAVDYYIKANKEDPHNANFKIGLNQARFMAAQEHLHTGIKLREKGDLQGAISQFQRATVLDPSSIVADQELKRTIDLLTEKTRETAVAEESSPEATSLARQPAMAATPPELKPLSRAPINLKMSNDAKVVYETIGKLAGLTVIYDPDLQAKRITTELNNVTLEQALDIVSLESKAIWKPVTENIIMIIPDTAQKRRDYEEQVVRTFYLNNVAIAQDLTEITTGLRQLLDFKRIQQVNAQNAIIIRDTPDKIALAEKIIRDIDKAKPEVIIQVQVLEARIDHMRNLGILPGQSASVQINPNANTSTTSGTSTPTTPGNGTVTLKQLTHLNQNDVVFTLPGATANFLLTDTGTKIIQDPELRAIDGQSAKLKIGDRVPVATGSFQAGVGVGSTGGAGFVNPLVNTQFQYIDVGVNLDVTPHVHANRDVSMKLSVEVSAVTGNATIGGITQPIISQRKVEHEIRLKEGEVSILAGLISRVDQKTLNGWPGLAKIPGIRYLFSTENVETQEDEVLIVLTPRVVRLPDWTRANLRPIYSGTESFPGARREVDVKAPTANPNPQLPPATPPAGQQPPPSGAVTPLNPATPVTAVPVPGPGAAPGTQVTGPRMHFEPATLNLAPGQTATIGVVVDNVTDLYSVPMLLQYNPAVISIEEVRHGGFLSGGTQEIAIVQRVDKEHGQAIISATRQPNTPGVNGTGTILGVVVRGLAPGVSNLSIVQVNAKDSQQRPISLVTSEATLRVQ